ncbi:MAG: 2-hydroxyglutaryl-CoA dehydratase, partial [Firmicutes bacterium HGW-Firmicutes-3]
MRTLGIDIGSTTSKCVLLEDGERIIGTELLVAGIGTVGAEKIMETVLKKADLSRDDIDFVMATGYGRRNFDPAHGELSELSCHAKGVLFTNPQVRTIIDIGGQDAKVLRINDKGVMENFMMNDKCAAGTGRFLDVMANILQMP